MSQPDASPPAETGKTLFFITCLSVCCAVILALLASALAHPQEVAKELDRSKQMMIAAKLLDHEGHFLLPADANQQEDKGSKDASGKEGAVHAPKYQFARYEQGKLQPDDGTHLATNSEILEVYKQRLRPLLVNAQGEITTFAKAGINQDQYLTDNKKSGYSTLPFKLLYSILPNSVEAGKEEAAQPIGYVIPINGFGLWDAIYGYLGVEPDGETVIGISWYDQKETPGLGANIAEESWQANFPGKKIFQPAPDGKINPTSAPIGITVVKGKVAEVLGNVPKAENAVDGMAGATLTGNGVTEAYRDVLGRYRPFFIALHKKSSGGSP